MVIVILLSLILQEKKKRIIWAEEKEKCQKKKNGRKLVGYREKSCTLFAELMQTGSNIPDMLVGSKSGRM